MNRVMLIGFVGNDPEVKYFEADQAVATLRLATTERGRTLPNGTVVPDRTEWHNLVFYRRLAKVVEQYVRKGDKLYVDGQLQYRRYDDKKGIQRVVTEIVVQNLELLTARQNGGSVQQQNVQTQPVAQQQEIKEEQNTINSSDEILPF